jgi:predicted RNase H-like HicB family nuclease
MTLKLHVTIGPDEDGWRVATCPELPGCITQGRTVEEAEANIREAIQASLITRKARGLPLKLDLHAIEVEVPA